MLLLKAAYFMEGFEKVRRETQDSWSSPGASGLVLPPAAVGHDPGIPGTTPPALPLTTCPTTSSGGGICGCAHSGGCSCSCTPCGTSVRLCTLSAPRSSMAPRTSRR